VVRTCFSVFNWSRKCCELSSASNCITDLFSVVERKKCAVSTFSKLVRGDSVLPYTVLHSM